MSIRFLNVLSIACLLSMSLAISMYSLGGHDIGEDQSVFSSASCEEDERYQGAHIYTVHKARAHVRSSMFNDMGDYNAGWYHAYAIVNHKVDDKADSYSGKVVKHADEEILYEQSPGEVSGSGSAGGYIYGIGCANNASDRSNYDEPYY